MISVHTTFSGIPLRLHNINIKTKKLILYGNVILLVGMKVTIQLFFPVLTQLFSGT